MCRGQTGRCGAEEPWGTQLAYQMTAAELLLDLWGLSALAYDSQSPVSKATPRGTQRRAPSHAGDKLTSARRTDQDHADLLGGERATELPGLESLYARLEPLELGVKALDFILDDAHGG